MGKKRKGIRYTLIVMAAAVTAAVLFALLRTDKGEPVVINRPTRETIIEKIPANGKIRPVTEVKISPDVSGEIIELNVDEGDRVRKGDLIIKIRQDVYISLRDRAEASLNSTNLIRPSRITTATGTSMRNGPSPCRSSRPALLSTEWPRNS